MKSQVFFTYAFAAALTLSAETKLLAPTPPMGWNSWDCFGTGVTELEVKQNADYMGSKLRSSGWQYIVVDIQWSERAPKTHGYREDAELAMDAYGRLTPAENRFPSASNGRGFKPLADYVHSKGLKFGIHIMRGIPRRAADANLPILDSKHRAGEVANRELLCKWNHDMYGADPAKGGQDYYDSIVKLYASWGVDFIKADDMFSFAPGSDRNAEIDALSKSIAKSGRPIVLSLSPGTRNTNQADFIARHAQMWRISGDFWDRWDDLHKQFARFNMWNPYVKVGHWPDGDMLPLGHIGIRAERGEPRMSLLTHEEQRTLMTLWSIARSPLMFGGNLPDNDEFTRSLMENADVLQVDQKASASRQLFAHGNQVAWMAEVPGSNAKYLAVFNTGDAGEEHITVQWSDLQLHGNCLLEELWSKSKTKSTGAEHEFVVKPHASAFYRVTPQ